MDDKHDFTYQREDTPENIEKSLDFLKSILRYKEDDREMEDGTVCHFVFFNAEDLMKQLAFPLSLAENPAFSPTPSYSWEEATLACNVTDHLFLTEARDLQDFVMAFSMTKVSAPADSAKPLSFAELCNRDFPGIDGMRRILYKGNHIAAYINPEVVYSHLLSYSSDCGSECPVRIGGLHAIIDFDEEKILLSSEEYRDFFESFLAF